jgi:myo-inositol-1(or 4)-monophosphatase
VNTLSSHDLDEVARTLIEIAREAAALVHAGWRTGVEIEHKGAIDLVTRFDRASEDLLRARFRERLPGFDVVAEESGGAPSGDRPVLWADPLDGTTNFAHGHPFFCVSIGLLDGATPLAAAVVAPALSVEYRAARGSGAWRNDVACGVSRTDELRESLLATGFPYDSHTRDENNLREFCALTRRTQGVRRCGSAALDLCLTAEGTYDAYWEAKLKPWDVAAGALVVLEAGGALSDLDGNTVDVRAGSLLASNGRIHDAVLRALRAVRGAPQITV